MNDSCDLIILKWAAIFERIMSYEGFRIITECQKVYTKLINVRKPPYAKKNINFL